MKAPPFGAKIKMDGASEAAFVDEQIRLLQTEFVLSDVPVWEGPNDFPPVSDAALSSAIRKRACL